MIVEERQLCIFILITFCDCMIVEALFFILKVCAFICLDYLLFYFFLSGV